MSKFKLIKGYPNSPELGFITDETMHFPASYPEFWEKVKEWEILEIIGKYGAVSSYIEKLDRNLMEKSIFRVRRASDNTIFSVGDKVINPKLKSNATFKITKFELDCEGEHMLALGGGGAIGIHKIEKYKEPLFITEDGVEIFKGDGYWQVTPEFKHYFIGNNDYTRRNCDKHFSTEKAAKDCIDLNKPQYSLQDILNAKLFGDDINNPKFAIDINKLKK